MVAKKNSRRPRFRFSDVGILAEEILSSKYDASVKCTVVRDGYVKFEGQEMTFTDATKQMFRRVRDPLPRWFPRGLQPSRHWKCRDRIVCDFHREAYPRDSEVWRAGEEQIPKGAPEGAVRAVQVNRYERDPKNRKAAIEEHGVRCFGCGLEMEERYGKVAKGFIHIHHVKPISAVRGNLVDPKRDLVPLCPNCHAVVHLKKSPLSIDKLKALIRKNRRS